MKNEKNSLIRFGKAGWGTIIYCLLMFWFYAGMVNDSTNIVAPAVAQRLGLEAGTVVSMGTVAGFIGVIFFFVFGYINRKIGARKTSFICLILAALGFIGMGNAVSLWMYAACLCVTTIGAMSAGYIAGGSLVTQWFPKKKGIVMGYTTMGHNMSTGFFVVMITACIASFGIEKGVLIPAMLALILAVAGVILIRNTPKERGMNPDNVTDEIYQKEYCTEEVDEDGGWTTKKLLTSKDFWLTTFGSGLFQMVSAVIVTQLVVRNMQLGFSQAQAMGIMTILSFAGIVGSWLIGVLDQKLGTKKTMLLYGVWYIVALMLNFTEIKPLIYVFLVMFAVALGGSANFTTSLPASVYGRHGFAKVNSILFPIQACICSCSFAINGIVLNMTGSLRYAYLISAVICLVNIIILIKVNEHKFNRDYIAEQKKS